MLLNARVSFSPTLISYGVKSVNCKQALTPDRTSFKSV